MHQGIVSRISHIMHRKQSKLEGRRGQHGTPLSGSRTHSSGQHCAVQPLAEGQPAARPAGDALCGTSPVIPHRQASIRGLHHTRLWPHTSSATPTRACPPPHTTTSTVSSSALSDSDDSSASTALSLNTYSLLGAVMAMPLKSHAPATVYAPALLNISQSPLRS
jgi:hypothetical protein